TPSSRSKKPWTGQLEPSSPVSVRSSRRDPPAGPTPAPGSPGSPFGPWGPGGPGGHGGPGGPAIASPAAADAGGMPSAAVQAARARKARTRIGVFMLCMTHDLPKILHPRKGGGSKKLEEGLAIALRLAYYS